MFSSSPSFLSFCHHTFFHLKTVQTQDSQQSEQSLSFRGIPSTPFVQVNTSKNILFWMCIKVFMKFKFTKNIQNISVLTHETLSSAPAAQLCNDSPSKQRHKLNYLCLISCVVLETPAHAIPCPSCALDKCMKCVVLSLAATR